MRQIDIFCKKAEIHGYEGKIKLKTAESLYYA